MKKIVTYKSHDQITTIYATIWIPTIPIKGIVQISHGMIECMSKYEEFANILNQEGYIVCGEDHLGHGRSVIDHQHLGYIAKKKGEEILVEDAHTLTKLMQKEYPGLQIFLLGFSFGSFIARNYMGIYGKELSGVILIGSGVNSTFAINAYILNGYIQSYFSGGDLNYSKTLEDQTIGKFPRYFANNSFKLCWLSKDYRTLDKYYRHNPETDFKFKTNGFLTLFRTMRMNNKRKILKGIPKELPILILSGKDDPVTHFGKDVGILEKKYTKLGINSVKGRFYNESRHDLLIEKEKDIIFNEIIRFITLKTDPSFEPITPPKVAKTIEVRTVKANFNKINEEKPEVKPEVPKEEPEIVEKPQEEVKEEVKAPEVKPEPKEEPKPEVTPEVKEETPTPQEGQSKKKKKKDKKKHQEGNTEVKTEEVPEEQLPEVKQVEIKAEETPEEPKKEEKKEELVVPKEENKPNPEGSKKKKKKDKKKEHKLEQETIESVVSEEKVSSNIEETELDQKDEDNGKELEVEKIETEEDKLNKIEDDGIFDEISFENFLNGDDSPLVEEELGKQEGTLEKETIGDEK